MMAGFHNIGRPYAGCLGTIATNQHVYQAVNPLSYKNDQANKICLSYNSGTNIGGATSYILTCFKTLSAGRNICLGIQI